MEKLSSRQNKTIAHLRKLGTDKAYRHACGEGICDGMKLLREALMWGVELVSVFWLGESEMTLPEGVKEYSLSSELMDYASPLKNSPGPIFTFRMPDWDKTEPGRCLVQL